jgi:hypothetical protein
MGTSSLRPRLACVSRGNSSIDSRSSRKSAFPNWARAFSLGDVYHPLAAICDLVKNAHSRIKAAEIAEKPGFMPRRL